MKKKVIEIILVILSIFSLPFLGIIIYCYASYFLNTELITRGEFLISAGLYVVLSVPLTIFYLLIRSFFVNELSLKLKKITDFPFLLLNGSLILTILISIIK